VSEDLSFFEKGLTPLFAQASSKVIEQLGGSIKLPRSGEL
jgi:hypothetical protein